MTDSWIKKRTKKRGFFYILQFGRHFKYGATTRNVQARMRWAKKKTGLECRVVYVKNSKDVFTTECQFKYQMWCRGIGADEFFEVTSELTVNELIAIAEGII